MIRTVSLAATACLTLTACQQTPEVVDMNKPAPACFSVSDFKSWRSPDAKTMYIRANVRNFYRLDLVGACSTLNWPGTYLITTFRGPTSICSHLDWDIKVAESGSNIAVPCMVEKMTPLTPAEAAAIPDKFKP
ncbi:DUF6491 family protein [Roseiterribacter gracilis]|uniref:Lipoprotein n=1 Tax=Roseiterribacter gracilis TaxID=2812848 RepID=A0A8S8XCN3_9PROT|nr:hypothetical protein TMPK1_18580 [Rhodospirillales bacterium TMPK1]